jgi:hypothetical protein
MGKLIKYNGITRLDLPVQQILDTASEGLDHKEGIVILGYDKEGETYFASSLADGREVLWLLQRAIHDVMDNYVGE